MIANGKTPAQVERETEEKLASLMSKVPEVRDAVRSLGAGGFCKKVFGRAAFFVDPNNDFDVSKRLLIGTLAIQVHELKEKLTDIQRKAEIACAGEKNWHYAFAARDRLIFANNVGDHAEMPIDVAHAIFTKTPADCRLRRGKTKVTFLRGERRVARIPKRCSPS